VSDKLRVYISFAEEDRRQVRELESTLRAAGFETWFDEKDLTAGSNWMDEIKQALPRSDVFVSCISTRSVSRPGFYDEEIALALELRKDRPAFVVPVRLDDCELPAPYQKAHLTWVDVFEEAGLERLISDLKTRAKLRDHARNLAPMAPSAAPAAKLVRILHLSDLHFKKGDDHKQLLTILDEDLEDDIDYLIVSGDLSDRCNEAGYQHATEFLGGLQSRRSIPKERCILVPGNHDVQRDVGSFEIREKVDGEDDAVKALAGDLETSIYLVRKPGSYADRFRRFAEVHRSFTGREYDLTDPGKQFCVRVFDHHRLQFLGLNSAWEIDQFRPKRSSIYSDALDDGLRSLRKKPGYLGIAVWHHAITGNDKISDDEFLGRLGQFGVRLCLHGDVHELRPDVVSPYSTSRIHVVGAGSFGAGAKDRPESTPRMYNLIEVDDDHTRARVSTRQQPRPGGRFEPYATWSVPGQREVRSGRYEFTLDPPASNRTVVSS
jgi:TIR domain/Calcineurin-like phosphoesterase